MSRKYNIRNLDDLHAEVSKLKAEYRLKEEVLIDDSKKIRPSVYAGEPD